MRRALIVGIDQYPTSPLNGCLQDAKQMESTLSRHHDGALNFDCRVITCPNVDVSRSSLKESIAELFANPAEIAWLHFSGHGVVNVLGGYLVTPDATKFDEGVPMTDILTLATRSPVTDKLITLDCCDSGAFGTLPTLETTAATLPDGLAVITATRPEQESLEVGGGGVFTSLLVEALEGGAAGILGEITVAGIYAYIDSALGAWEQRPLFKANLSRFAKLRDSKPRVELEVLRKMQDYFPLPAEEHPLDPSYEPSLKPHHAEHEKVFADLQKLRDAGLVEPVDETHMFFAAVNSKACQLTTLGKYYWRLLDNDRI